MPSKQNFFQFVNSTFLVLGVTISFFGVDSTAEPYLAPILAIALFCLLVSNYLTHIDQHHDYFNCAGQCLRIYGEE